eukprot:2135702-Heterocapsa_arctica.AAC.1
MQGTGPSPKETSGGVALLFQQHLHITKFHEAETIEHGPVKLSGDRWVLVQVRLRKTSITLGTAYLHPGRGLDAENVALLGSLGA